MIIYLSEIIQREQRALTRNLRSVQQRFRVTEPLGKPCTVSSCQLIDYSCEMVLVAVVVAWYVSIGHDKPTRT